MLAEIYKTYKEFRKATNALPTKLTLSHDMKPYLFGSEYIHSVLEDGKVIDITEYGGVPIEWVEGENVCYFSL